MSTPEESGKSDRYHEHHGRKMSRRNAARKRKKSAPFLPDFNGLERRMMPATFTVNAGTTRAAGSLRQAITDSNATPGSNVIDFGIGTGARLLALVGLADHHHAGLDRRHIAAGIRGAPLIDVDGTSTGDADGLDLEFGSGGSTILGLVINNFGGDGILIASSATSWRARISGPTPPGTAAGG